MACGRHSAHLELFVPKGCRTGKLKDILELFDFTPDGKMEAEGGLKALVWDFMDEDVIPDNLHGKLQNLTWRWEGSAARLVMCMSDGCGWYADTARVGRVESTRATGRWSLTARSCTASTVHNALP